MLTEAILIQDKLTTESVKNLILGDCNQFLPQSSQEI
jgi:hypothetical protein